MGSRVHYTVVGIFVVFLTVVAFGIFYWLTAQQHDNVYDTYIVYVHEDVTGLTVQSPVRFNGVKVGYVDQITLDPTNPQLVRILLKIIDSTPITTATVASLNSQGITGVVYVGLKATKIDAPPLTPKPGEKHPVIPARPSLLVQLSTVLPEITEKIQVVGDRIAALLDEQNRTNIADTLKNLSKFTKMLSDNSKRLDQTIASLDKTMQNTAKASQQFPEVMTKFKQTLGKVEGTTDSINKAAESFTGAMQHGTVAISNFSVQVLPSTQNLLNRLDRLTQHLQVLSQDLQQNPSVIIRGKAPSALGPGEK